VIVGTAVLIGATLLLLLGRTQAGAAIPTAG
jgi:hypothetical protein